MFPPLGERGLLRGQKCHSALQSESHFCRKKGATPFQNHFSELFFHAMFLKRGCRVFVGNGGFGFGMEIDFKF
jgi:hypothetical protein